MKARGLVLIMTVVICCQSSFARIITVDNDGPADFNNIQAAINDADNGDEIVVEDGIYTGAGNRDIDFMGKAITVRSKYGASSCIIDANGTDVEPHRGFIFTNGECETSILQGFTVKKGFIYEIGGAIACLETCPVIKDCVLIDNMSLTGGGGLGCAFACSGIAPVRLVNCTIVNNYPDGAFVGGGGGAWAEFENCIFWENSLGDIGRSCFSKCGCAHIYVNYSVLQAEWENNPWVNGSNNMIVDPCFVDPCSGDFHLKWESPCINAGDPNYQPGPDIRDMDGSLRVIQGIVDIGADEKCKFPKGHPDYDASSWPESGWIYSGEPDCWCYPRQCHGDADGLKEGSSKIGYWYVGNSDLNILASAWYVAEPPRGPGIDTIRNGICADFAHRWDVFIKCGIIWRVGTDDLNVMGAYWNVKEPTKGPGVPPDCLDIPPASSQTEKIAVAAEANDCFPKEHPDYVEWVSVGKPDCWCYPRQCHGDACYDLEGDDESGYWYVGKGELDFIMHFWEIKEPPHGPGINSYWHGICFDIAHDAEGNSEAGYWRIGQSDLNTFTKYFKVLEHPHGPGVPDDCLDVP